MERIVEGNTRIAISWSFMAAAVIGSVAYVIAKSVATDGNVTFAQPLYICVGLLPFLVIPAIGLVVSRTGKAFPTHTIGFAVAAWLTTLFVFIALSETHVTDQLYRSFFRSIGYGKPLFDVTFSAAYAIVGVMVCLIILSLVRRLKMPAYLNRETFCGTIALTAAMFYTLVF